MEEVEDDPDNLFNGEVDEDRPDNPFDDHLFPGAAELRPLSRLYRYLEEFSRMHRMPEPVDLQASNSQTMIHVRQLLDRHPEILRERMPRDEGYLPLHRVCVAGDGIQIVQLVYERYTEAISVADDLGRLPLHLSCMGYGDVSEDVLKFLIEQYPQAVEEKDSKGSLPIHLACHGGRVSNAVILILLERFPKSIETRDGKGFLPLHLACHGGRVSKEVICKMIEIYPEAVSLPCRADGRLPLHLACTGVRVEKGVVQALIDTFPDSIRTKDTLGRLPLHVACKAHNHPQNVPPDALQMLVQAYPAALSEPDGKWGIVPIHVLCRWTGVLTDEIMEECVTNHPETLTLRDDMNRVPLLIAVQWGPPELAEIIRNKILQCAKIVINTDRKTYTELFMANCWDLRVVARFMDEWRGFPFHDFGNGQLPLHIVCSVKSPSKESEVQDALRVLVWRAPETVARQDVNGETPFHLLMRNRCCSKSLVKIFCDASADALRIRDNLEGMTPLHIFCKLRYPTDHLDIMGLLVNDCPATLSMQDNHGQTPLHLKLKYSGCQSLAVTNILCQSKQTLKTRDKAGQTPLHVACARQSSQVQLTKKLLENYPEAIYMEDNDGFTPLLAAAMGNARLSMIFLLLRLDPQAAMNYIVSPTELHVDKRAKRDD
jgi:ankyrin repeat protein